MFPTIPSWNLYCSCPIYRASVPRPRLATVDSSNEAPKYCSCPIYRASGTGTCGDSSPNYEVLSVQLRNSCYRELGKYIDTSFVRGVPSKSRHVTNGTGRTRRFATRRESEFPPTIQKCQVNCKIHHKWTTHLPLLWGWRHWGADAIHLSPLWGFIVGQIENPDLSGMPDLRQYAGYGIRSIRTTFSIRYDRRLGNLWLRLLFSRLTQLTLPRPHAYPTS